MKLLLDQNLSYRLIKELESKFPNSRHVRDVGLLNSNDIDILRYAHLHQYVVVTHDEDFYELSLDQAATPKIVWLRTGNLSRQSLLNLLLKHQADIVSLVNDPDIWCLEIN